METLESTTQRNNKETVYTGMWISYWINKQIYAYIYSYGSLADMLDQGEQIPYFQEKGNHTIIISWYTFRSEVYE